MWLLATESDRGLCRWSRWSRGWVSSSEDNSNRHYRPVPPCPILTLPVISSEQPVQSNPGCADSALPTFTLPISIAGLLRCRCEERLTPLELDWLTEAWRPIVGTAGSTSSRSQLPTLWPLPRWGESHPWQWATQHIYKGLYILSFIMTRWWLYFFEEICLWRRQFHCHDGRRHTVVTVLDHQSGELMESLWRCVHVCVCGEGYFLLLSGFN